MTKLTETQALILTGAAQHRDGIAAPPANLPPAPRAAVAKAMIKAGLLDVAQDIGAQHADNTWKLDGEAVVLRITALGRAAIGGAPETPAEAVQEASLRAPDAERGTEPTDAAEAAQEAPTGLRDATTPEPAATAPTSPQDGADAGSGAELAHKSPPAAAAPLAPSTGLRDAAHQVLAAWDDDATERAGLADAIERLRGALPTARAPRQSGAPRLPRSGTKQQTVLALLRRAEGASGPDIIAATGWQPHTVRGFLAGLKKRGIEVLVHERVRQVGPSKEGAKGSYTVYRIAEAG